MLRGARIDLQSAAKGLDALKQVYERDLRAGTVSDDAIEAVTTVVRSLEGAMGKTADGVAVQYATQPKKPGARLRAYFPLTDNPAEFKDRLGRNLPGVGANYPRIAAAFERHQPYQPDRSELGYLKELYRVNHHHDFTVQETRNSQFVGVFMGGFRMGLDTVGETSGWEVLASEEVMALEPKPGLPPTTAGVQHWIDWYFLDPSVSVATTLLALHRLCSEACEDVSATAGL